jgi:hypothetical protein
MFSPRRPQGKRQLCWVLRDGLAGIHHQDAPQKPFSSTEEMNANQLVDILLLSLFGGLQPAAPWNLKRRRSRQRH